MVNVLGVGENAVRWWTSMGHEWHDVRRWGAGNRNPLVGVWRSTRQNFIKRTMVEAACRAEHQHSSTRQHQLQTYPSFPSHTTLFSFLSWTTHPLTRPSETINGGQEDSPPDSVLERFSCIRWRQGTSNTHSYRYHRRAEHVLLRPDVPRRWRETPSTKSRISWRKRPYVKMLVRLYDDNWYVTLTFSQKP